MDQEGELQFSSLKRRDEDSSKATLKVFFELLSRVSQNLL